MAIWSDASMSLCAKVSVLQDSHTMRGSRVFAIGRALTPPVLQTNLRCARNKASQMTSSLLLVDLFHPTLDEGSALSGLPNFCSCHSFLSP